MARVPRQCVTNHPVCDQGPQVCVNVTNLPESVTVVRHPKSVSVTRAPQVCVNVTNLPESVTVVRHPKSVSVTRAPKCV